MNESERGVWSNDWNSFFKRFDAARTAALNAIHLAPDIKPVEDEYQALTLAMNRTPGHYERGDFQDLVMRLQAAKSGAIDFKGEPQPVARDIDLIAYQASDTAIRAGERAVRQATEGT